jgi:dihydrolipoamide dehydrogenase
MARYTEVAKGYAMDEKEGFVKVVVDARDRRILGCHIVGSDAADLVQQVVYLMNTDTQGLEPLARAQVIHPALSEVVITAFSKMHGHSEVHKHAHKRTPGHRHKHG